MISWYEWPFWIAVVLIGSFFAKEEDTKRHPPPD